MIQRYHQDIYATLITMELGGKILSKENRTHKINDTNITFSHVCQLQRLTIKFCKNSHSSRGVRQFIESSLLDFSRKNSGVAVYMKPRFHRTPVIVAEYLNGQRQWMNIRNFSATEINWWLEILRTRFYFLYKKSFNLIFLSFRSGYELTQLLSNNNVLTPSVQGVWNPFLNKPNDLLQKEFPNEERSAFISDRKSATMQLLEMMEKFKVDNDNKVEK